MHDTWHDSSMDDADFVSRILRHDTPFGPSTASISAGRPSCVWLMQVKWGIVCKHQICDGTWHDSMMDAADSVLRFLRHDTSLWSWQAQHGITLGALACMYPSDARQMKALFVNTKHAWYLARLQDGCCRLCFENSSSWHIFLILTCSAQHEFGRACLYVFKWCKTNEGIVCEHQTCMIPGTTPGWMLQILFREFFVMTHLVDPDMPSAAWIWARLFVCIWVMQDKWRHCL